MPKNDKLPFEKSMEELEAILETLSDGTPSLDESLQLYARAAELIKECHTTLEKAQVTVDEITLSLQEKGEGNDL